MNKRGYPILDIITDCITDQINIQYNSYSLNFNNKLIKFSEELKDKVNLRKMLNKETQHLNIN